MSCSSDLIDVAVIGGGAAGLNAALMLSRVRRSVAVIDSGTPRNAPAEGIHGLLGHEGARPVEFLERGRAEVRQYGGSVVFGEVVQTVPLYSAPGDHPRFGIELADGTSLLARRILIATGVRDQMPAIPGLAEHWGRAVIHCPFCHGWETRDRPIGVIVTSPFSWHQALMFHTLTDDLMVFTSAGAGIDQHDRERCDALGVSIIRTGVKEVVSASDGELVGVRLLDGQLVPRGALAVAVPTTPRLDGLEGLHLPLEELPGGMGHKVATGVGGSTEVPGVWAAGNAADPSAQVGMAAASGARAGGSLAWSLVNEDADVPVCAE